MCGIYSVGLSFRMEMTFVKNNNDRHNRKSPTMVHGLNVWHKAKEILPIAYK